jgi:hypothetical protein
MDGRVHKIGEELRFSRWAIRGAQAHLDLEPVRKRDLELELGVAKACLHWRFGRYTGWIVADDGTRADVDRMPGWLEHVDARW